MKRRTQRSAATAVAALGLAAGCQLIGGIDPRSVGSEEDAAGDVGVEARTDGDATASNVDAGDAVSQADGGSADSGDATADAGDARDASDAAVEAADAGDSSPEASTGCPNGGGPLMIPVGNYCIDSTEVTVGQYAVFLAAVDAGAQIPVSPSCSSGASFVPGGSGGVDWPQSPGNVPVDEVTWCDAWSFCKWAGKRLCGAIGGGPIAPSDESNAAISQWYAACSDGGSLAFPYGNTYNSSACNGPGGGSPEAVGSHPLCVGGYGGIFDMSGNVGEWEDNCNGTGANASCDLRGGSYDTSSQYLACNVPTTGITRSNSFYDTGFRCCAP